MTQKEKTALKKYEKYLNNKKLQASTITTYLWHLEKFFAWLKNQKLSTAKLKKYQEELLKNHSHIASINLRLVILNDFLKLEKNSWQFPLLSAEKQKIEILDKKQLDQFLNSPKNLENILNLRNKVLLEILYFSALKVKEIVLLKKEDFDLKNNFLLWQKKKIKLPQETKNYLLKYLNKRIDDSPYLFLNFDRAKKDEQQQLSIRSVERILEKYARQMQPILRITPQTLRHTLAYHLKQNGAQVKEIQNALHFQSSVAAQEYFKKL
ncbi:tyrosine-type recombinase/integrase [Candidatus Nomurabacteria bacterium]|nr:tyrosine-type recombinase/integrase [Candidatus Nomurabacteria bacterium]